MADKKLTKEGDYYIDEKGEKYRYEFLLFKIIDGKKIPAEGSFTLNNDGKKVAYVNMPKLNDRLKKSWTTPFTVTDESWLNAGKKSKDGK